MQFKHKCIEITANKREKWGIVIEVSILISQSRLRGKSKQVNKNNCILVKYIQIIMQCKSCQHFCVTTQF